MTTALQGAGGFGKTRLATWACHQPEVGRRYPGGLLWVTVGQQVHGADLAERINNVTALLGGQRPPISDPDSAGAELGRLLDQRDPVLLVVDDVWEESQLRPFRLGGRKCTRLFTTRIPDLLPTGGRRVLVDAMSGDQARQLLSDGVVGLPPNAADRLAEIAGRWPVLLNLINGALRRRVARGQPSEQAAAEIVRRLRAEGPTTFDPTRPSDRSQAVKATMEASMALLEPADARRYADLAIFPEDVDIPLDVLALLWPDRQVDALSEELVGLGLVADYRLDPPGPRLVLHDVMRSYLQLHGVMTQAHERMIAAAASLLPDDGAMPRPWWLLPPDAGYLWRYLPLHLLHSGRGDELVALVLDLRWVEAKTARFGSVVAVEADLELRRTPVGDALRSILRQAAHLFGPIQPATALGATLASRLHGVPELEHALAHYLETAPRPRLMPAWPLPDQPDPTATISRNGGLTSCAFSPDGDLLAATSDDATTRLWQLPDFAERTVLSGHNGQVNECSFSPDSTLLATTSNDHTIRLWRIPDGTEHAVLAGHTGRVNGCAFSPDGTLLATTSADHTVRLWRVADGSEQMVLSGHTGRIYSCAFSPDGALLATTSADHTARLWQVSDGNEQAVLSGHTNEVSSCAFSPDGTLLATTGDDATVRLWRTSDGTEWALLRGSSAWLLSCAFSPDGALLATTSFDHTTTVWRVSDGTPLAQLIGHIESVNGCAFSADGALLATVSYDRTVRLWSMPDGGERGVLSRGTSPLAYCAFSPDGALLAVASSDATVELRRMPEGARHAMLAGHNSRIIGCAFSPDGTVLATASHDRTVRLWRMPDGAPAGVLTGHTDAVAGCAFSPDGTMLASTGKDYTVRLWRLADTAEVAVLTGHTDWGERCAFSPDGSLLVSTSKDSTVRLWRVPSGEPLAVLTAHTDWVDGCTFSSDGALFATTSRDRTVRLWRMSDGALAGVLTGHTDTVAGCAFSPDGLLLATTSFDRTARVWQIRNGRCLCALRVSAPLVAVAWHPDGAMLCAVGVAGAYLFTYEP